LHFLDNVTIGADRNLVRFRLPVQYVVRPHQDFRVFSRQSVAVLVMGHTFEDEGEEETVVRAISARKATQEERAICDRQ
jgi:sulfate adenylyltransferase subunit 1 (EFTu-like GTPase family)